MNLPFMTLLLLSGCCVSTAYANVPFKTVSECQSDYFNGNYCSPSNISKYKTALKNQKANFDKKYILLNTGTVNALEMIAIDTQSGIAYPLNYQFTGWEDNQGNVKKKPSYTFSLNDPKLCLMGSQFDGDHPGTHETYSNIRNCFTIQKDRATTSFDSTYTDKVQYEYDEKNKTWTPYPN